MWFGSEAQGTADSWSDLDLAVCADSALALRWARAMHASLPVVLFRPFSAGGQPGGRYWFRGCSPWLRLDVSFHAPADWDDLIRNGRGFATPPFRPLPLDNLPLPSSDLPVLPIWSVRDHAFGGALRNFHETVKAIARGREPKHDLETALDGCREFETEQLSPGAWELWQLSDRIARDAGIYQKT